MHSIADENAYAILSTELFAVVDGQEVPVRAVIRKPFESRDQHFICAASITGLFHRKADLEAATPELAVVAARHFLQLELNGYISGGGQLVTGDHLPLQQVNSLFEPAGTSPSGQGS